MNREERFQWILEQEDKLRQDRLKHQLSTSKHQTKMDTLNLGVSIISMQASAIIIAGLCGVNDND